MSRGEKGLGRLLRDARLKSWRSQKELAEAVRFPQSSYSKAESGELVPPGAVLVRLARELGLSQDVVLAAAGKLQPWAYEYMRRHPVLLKVVHEAAARRLDDAELERVLALVRGLGGSARGSVSPAVEEVEG